MSDCTSCCHSCTFYVSIRLFLYCRTKDKGGRRSGSRSRSHSRSSRSYSRSSSMDSDDSYLSGSYSGSSSSSSDYSRSRSRSPLPARKAAAPSSRHSRKHNKQERSQRRHERIKEKEKRAKARREKKEKRTKELIREEKELRRAENKETKRYKEEKLKHHRHSRRKGRDGSLAQHVEKDFKEEKPSSRRHRRRRHHSGSKSPERKRKRAALDVERNLGVERVSPLPNMLQVSPAHRDMNCLSSNLSGEEDRRLELKARHKRSKKRRREKTKRSIRRGSVDLQGVAARIGTGDKIELVVPGAGEWSQIAVEDKQRGTPKALENKEELWNTEIGRQKEGHLVEQHVGHEQPAEQNRKHEQLSGQNEGQPSGQNEGQPSGQNILHEQPAGQRVNHEQSSGQNVGHEHPSGQNVVYQLPLEKNLGDDQPTEENVGHEQPSGQDVEHEQCVKQDLEHEQLLEQSGEIAETEKAGTGSSSTSSSAAADHVVVGNDTPSTGHNEFEGVASEDSVFPATSNAKELAKKVEPNDEEQTAVPQTSQDAVVTVRSGDEEAGDLDLEAVEVSLEADEMNSLMGSMEGRGKEERASNETGKTEQAKAGELNRNIL